jgi:bacillolysin
VAADPATDPEIGLEDLQDNPNVSVRTDSDGTVRVLNGAFTDTTVTDAADAAQVINAMSELIGAPTDFAAADNITVQKVGTDGSFSETFYRVNQSVDGVEVLGGQVVLVTDADGKVTGLFNNDDSRADSIDRTMSRSLDTENEAAAAALAAYVGSSNSLPHRLLAPALIKAGVVKADLVIDDLDDAADPQLVWRVVVTPPDTSELTGTVDAGSTYYISANNTTAGSIQREVSSADALTVSSSATTTTKDELGVSRDINISQLNLLIFSVDILDDKSRDITTHITSYLFFVGPPLTPGFVAIRGLNGWDAEAVSAPANVAEVYDYYSNMLGLHSFDGLGAPIVVSVDYNPRESLDDYVSRYQNAFWDASK